jgi:hypothetical protein
MTGASRLRSLAAAEASRRNGALSKGPKTALGKLKASQSSRKHGLFRAGLLTGGEVPALAAGLEDILVHTSTGSLDLADQPELVRLASAQLDEATRLVGAMRARLDQLLIDDALDTEQLRVLLQRITRMARYQRRFRGKRDRALRRLMAGAAKPTA